MSAGLSFQGIQSLNPKSILVTSGSLSPLDSLESDFQIEFKHKLSNQHVITAEQVDASILEVGFNGNEFDFSYQNRSKRKEMIVDIADTLIRLLKHVPGGILLFFASYQMMQETYDEWYSSSKLSVLENLKPVFKEPKS
jgi:regulator of telomere elongation helicase 1